jgi:hypothetical protein
LAARREEARGRRSKRACELGAAEEARKEEEAGEWIRPNRSERVDAGRPTRVGHPVYIITVKKRVAESAIGLAIFVITFRVLLFFAASGHCGNRPDPAGLYSSNSRYTYARQAVALRYLQTCLSISTFMMLYCRD